MEALKKVCSVHKKERQPSKECLGYHGHGDGASSPLPHPRHANAPDVMGTDNSWCWCMQGCVWKVAPAAETQSLCETSTGLNTFDKVLKTFLLPKHICGTDKVGERLTIFVHFKNVARCCLCCYSRSYVLTNQMDSMRVLKTNQRHRPSHA